MIKIPNAVIFSVLRTLKKLNPGDTYYENYLWHLNKRQETFFDIYHFAWSWGIEHQPKKIFEIGTRTGISLAQLLSSYVDYSKIEKIVTCDLFNDGYLTPNLVKMYLDYLGIPQNIIEKVEFLVGDSKITIPQFKKMNPNFFFDYILVDGSHDQKDARTDLENVSSLIEKSGVLIFDDIALDGMNLGDVWQDFKNSHTQDFEWHEDYNGKGLGWCTKL
jgi:predicted O-methyltransferase YrrM